MKIPCSWQRTHEFACHEASCAPPPAGTGGSTGKGGSVKETNVQEGKRRAAESAAKLTPAQRAHVDRLVKSVPERLKHILVGPPNSKGRQSWKWDSAEAKKRFTEQSKKV